MSKLIVRQFYSFQEQIFMFSEFVIPKPIPAKKVPGYKMPEGDTALLSWDFIATQMEASLYYWLSTNYADGRPHVVPVWGIWYKNRVHFDGSPHIGWARNLKRDPRIAVHLPDAQQVVVIEGRAYIIEDDELDSTEWAQIDTRFQAKYKVEKGSPYWYVQPTKVLAWDGGGLETMTRWIFA
jgi:general stress protein 26